MTRKPADRDQASKGPAPEPFMDPEQIAAVVQRLADEISERHDDGVVLVAVLRGTLPFMADLVRALSIEALVDFVALTPYVAGSGRVRLLMDVTIDLADRDVVIVEEIVDTGLTSAFLLRELSRRGPRSLSVCTLLDRRARRVVPVELSHVGTEIDDRYVIGYGLDHEGLYRNLASMAFADLEVVSERPDAYVEVLYTG